jgi:hypothetical protein
MSKHDGRLHLRGETTELMRLLLARRSVRRFGVGTASDAQLGALLDTARAFQQRCGWTAPRLVMVSGAERDAVVKAAMRGWIALVNPWLPSTEAKHLLLCATTYPDGADEATIERALAEAAMTMQVAVLAATELGLATCWMAGIDHAGVERALPLPDGARLVALSPIGLLADRKGLWETAMFHLVSKRRKPLAELWMKERWESR